MTRVMMVVPQYPYPVVGGLERQAHELAKALRELGLHVQAISGKIQSEQSSFETVEGVLVHRISWSKRKWLRFLRTPFDLFKVLFALRGTYDIIHLHQHSWFALFTIIISRILGKPVLTKLANVREGGIPGILLQQMGRLKLKILMRSDALVAMSQESLLELKGIGYPLTRVLATPNGIRLNFSQRIVQEKVNYRSFCRVVCVGRLSHQKRIDDLLYAWQKIIGAIGHVALLEIWGSGPLDSELRQLSDNLNISESVVFLGNVDDVRVRLGTMDVFVLPSHAEGNSNAILEAMAASLPIVSTRVGGTPMLVGAEGADLLVDVSDREALASCLLKLIQDSSLRTAVGTAMRLRVETHFDIHQRAHTYADAYQYLLEDKRDQICEVSNPIIMES